MTALAFDFGANWQAFSDARMTPERFQAAVQSLESLIGADELSGKSLLDVGCGSGLFSLAASAAGCARVVGVDVNPKCVQASRDNGERLRAMMAKAGTLEFRQGSALDAAAMRALGAFDIVYAWGSLHHTGAMWDAIRNSAACVSPGGMFTLAIYNAHWSCWGWKQIKRLYNLSPRPVRRLFNGVFAIVIGAAKWLVTRRNPFVKQRGMDFWYDVIDWLGGYPYEYASAAAIAAFLQPLGFVQKRCVPPEAPTGCNEFVFVRTGGPSGSSGTSRAGTQAGRA
ncbi:MAG: class I SAM-dependent methyltransferase [Lentisphaerae bacterium]|nr:class I SAM-dependent methyltransferase [Lentisphaerota bacterium]